MIIFLRMGSNMLDKIKMFLTENSAVKVIDWINVSDSSKKVQHIEPYLKDGLVYTVEEVDKTHIFGLLLFDCF